MTQAQNTEARQNWLSLLATAPDHSLAELCDKLGTLPAFDWLRPPEIGSVMVRGRTGGSGSPFNLGEVTVTRCALQLRGSDVVGHGYVQGRDKAKAERAALIDALMQTDAAPTVRDVVLSPLGAARDQARTARAARAAATRVEFFTMVRGED